MRMINRARVDALFSPPGQKEWHYPANLSVLYEERKSAKELLLSHLISYAYAPGLNPKERAELKLKIFGINKNIENVDEDGLLEILIGLKQRFRDLKKTEYFDELLVNVPIGLCLKDGKLAIYEDYPAYLAGPAPVFAHILNSMDFAVSSYELIALLEFEPRSIKLAYERQENTLTGLLGEFHYSTMFPFILLANRQGKYIFHRGYYGLEATNFKTPPYIVQRRKRAMVVGVDEIFASRKHAEWFVKNFIQENMLHEAYITLKDAFADIKQNNLGLVFFEEEVNLAYIEKSGQIHILMPDGLYRL